MIHIFSFNVYHNFNIYKKNYLINDNFDKEFAETISKPLPKKIQMEGINNTNISTPFCIENSETNISNLYIFDPEVYTLNDNLYKTKLLDNYNITKIKKKNKIIPNIFDIFPELNLLWPNWSFKNNKRIQCKIDEDCKFPQACCHHPIIPGNKFCCTGGYKQRVMKLGYIGQIIQNNINNN